MVAAKWIGSPNFTPQSGIIKNHITDHWMVGTLASTDRSFNGGARGVSATYGVGQTEVHQYVQEKDYPYSDGNTYSNRYGISIEHEGGYLLPDGTRKNPTPETCELSARLHADIARRHGLGRLAIGVNVFPHKHWVNTACPGTLDMIWVVNRANELLNAGGTAGAVDAGTTAPAGVYAKHWNGYKVTDIQALLNAHGAHLVVDGEYGPQTEAAAVVYQKSVGLKPDGNVGPLTWSALHGGPAKQSGRLDVDGAWGALTTKALQRALGVEDDGVIGPQTIKALQRRIGAAPDGALGPQTRKALQRHLGVKQDGVWGTNTTRALQARLNAGTF